MEAQLHRDHDDLQPADLHVKEERGGETRSAMKKVKEKVNKLKATLKHGQDEAQSVNDSPVVRSGLVEPTVMGTPVLAEDLYATHSDIVDVPVRSFAQWEDEERRHAPPPLSTDYGTLRTDQGPHVGPYSHGQDANRGQFEHTAPLPVSTGVDTRVTDAAHVGHQVYDQSVSREQLKGGVVLPSPSDEEGRHVASPQWSTGYEACRTDAPRGATNTGGEEVGITGVLKSFNKMKVYDEPDAKSSQSEQPEPNVYTGSHDQFAPEPVETPPLDTITDNPSNPNSSYTQRISSATSAIADKAAALKDTMVSKLSSFGENKTEGSAMTHKASTRSSFPTEFSHKVADTLSSTLGPVYEKVAGGGGSVMSKMQDETSGGSGVRVKEYLVDTFKPVDDDKVLSEAITHALNLGKRNQQPPETSTTTYVVRDGGERRVQDSGNN